MAKTNTLTADTILNDLAANKIHPVYFLQGDEPFFIDQITIFIEKQLLPESQRGFNQTILYGKETDITSVITAAKRFPMMSDKQVIIVKEAQDLKDLDKTLKSKVNGKEVEYSPLEEYIKKPVPSTILLFAYKHKVLDGRKQITKLLEERTMFFTSKGLYDNELPSWIIKMVKQKGASITERASQLLAEFVGNNLSRLSNEVDKILINFKDKAHIEEKHVLNFVGVSKEYNVFELQNALSRKDVLKSNTIISFFAENIKDNPLQQLTASLFGYFSKILLVKTSRSFNEFEVSKAIGLPPFIAKEYILAAKNYNDPKLLDIFSYLREADLRSKGYGTNAMSEKAIMQDLIFKILH